MHSLLLFVAICPLFISISCCTRCTSAMTWRVLLEMRWLFCCLFRRVDIRLGCSCYPQPLLAALWLRLGIWLLAGRWPSSAAAHAGQLQRNASAGWRLTIGLVLDLKWIWLAAGSCSASSIHDWLCDWLTQPKYVTIQCIMLVANESHCNLCNLATCIMVAEAVSVAFSRSLISML